MHDALQRLQAWGFPTNPNTRLVQGIDDAIEACEAWHQRREELDYDIDGMVLKVNSYALQQRARLCVAVATVGHRLQAAAHRGADNAVVY